MSEFTLDTSGVVRVPIVAPNETVFHTDNRWSDFDPFAQGYVVALFASAEHPNDPYKGSGPRRPVLAGDAPTSSVIAWMPLGFSDLAPETVLAIVRDCAAAQRLWPHVTTTAAAGASLWTQRQAMVLAEFGPVTPYLGDDGKVYLREAA